MTRRPAAPSLGGPVEAVPRWRAPMLATLTTDRFSDPGWIFEPKFDGVRCLAYRDGEHLRLWSRNRQSLGNTYPELAEALAAQPCDRFVVDGEIVAFAGRRTSFARLQQRMQLTDPGQARASGVRVFYYVFDVLHLDRRRTTGLPLRERKRLLRAAISFADPIRYTRHRVGAGEDAFRAACARGDEGVIAKRADAAYTGRRSSDWLKFKCSRGQEFVIGGYTAPRGSRVGFGALLVGYHDRRGRLVYAGKVGTGYDTATLHRLADQLAPLHRATSPFAGPVREPHATWVQPRLVAQIAFTEWTRDGKLRHPRYVGQRTDKPAGDVVREPG